MTGDKERDMSAYVPSPEDVLRGVEMMQAIRDAATLGAQPQVVRFLIHSQQEMSAVMEHVERADPNAFLSGLYGMPQGIPIVVDESVPAGVLRPVWSDGREAQDVVIR